ncbi:DUF4402 domain-containing protein [Gillisia marina]|uniref:DUF4402 domain-containing protein n=1 Tax=Gillisia marina TaxID=1167637 RepID=UPI00029B55B3|nr:DUF4402 domain-containing protein [Gillisia marina]
MKKITFILIALITGTTFAQSAEGTATVNAAIVSPITISNSSSNLDFGNIATPDAATDIVVSTAGTRTAVAGVTIPGGTISAASFTINAANTYGYTISIPAIDLKRAGEADMSVSFSSSLGATSTGTGADQTLNVGGTLTVGASQGAGAYTGTATVTVAYQ